MTVYGETTEPGEPGGKLGLGDPPLGGGASAGSGVILLLTLGAIYGGKRVYDLMNHQEENKKPDNLL